MRDGGVYFPWKMKTFGSLGLYRDEPVEVRADAKSICDDGLVGAIYARP